MVLTRSLCFFLYSSVCKSIDIESFAVQEWNLHLRPCEHEQGILYKNDPCQGAQPRLSSMKTDD